MITILKKILPLSLLALAITLLGLTTQKNTQITEQTYNLMKSSELTSQGIPPGEKLLQDDFNRVNAGTLGSPWVEGNEVLTEYINSKGRKVGPGYVELNNNSLAFHYNNHSQKVIPDPSFNQNPYVTAPLSKQVSTYPVTIYFTFTPHADERIAHIVGLMSAADGLTQMTDPSSGRIYFLPKNGVGVMLIRSSLNFSNTKVMVIKYINNVETVIAEENLTFQFDSGVEYTIQMTIERDFVIEVVASSPTEFNGFTYASTSVPFALDQFFLVDAEGGISFDTDGVGDYRLFFDDILVQQTYRAYLPLVVR